MDWLARITAFIPEAHTLLTVVQTVDSGMPARSAAWRAGACPRPAESTFPMITSVALMEGTRSLTALMAMEPSWHAETEARLPLKEPTGVRAAPTITTSSCRIAKVTY